MANSVDSESILRFFSIGHLRPELAEVSRPFCDLAHHVFATLPRHPERSVALRKLLEAKDAAVRAKLVTLDDNPPAGGIE
jgi:hypothetical protein